MKRTIAALVCAGLVLCSASSTRAQERSMEQLLLDEPTAAGAQADSARINQESHYAGTPGDYHIAQWMRDELASAGLQARLETFTHDVPFSSRLELEMFQQPRWISLKLGEVPIPEDPDGTRRDAGPPFNAWSGSGVVTASVVDVGHGLDADYQALAARGIDVRSHIALIRYGREFRGSLAKRAQDRGAKGVIFFDDPADRDGSLSGPAYPAGPYRPPGSVQRGALEQGPITIPTLPVNALVAQRILSTMSGGVSNVPFRLTVVMDIKRNIPLWNTVGVLPGVDPSHSVVIGAHRDAWVYGVTDNGSGIAVVLATARALGYLYKSGWRPRYSIVLVGFDGEEIGEVGSQAYVQMHRAELGSGCIVYINEDEIATGTTFAAGAAAALQDAIVPATQMVPDPQTATQTLYERWRAQRGGTLVRNPAGGSDFESFLYGPGIPVAEFGFFGIFGTYHSGFDDLRYATTQADPGFVNHRAISQLVALLAMRFASGPLPYRLTPYARLLRSDATAVGAARQRDLQPLFAAIDRFARASATADSRGMNGTVEIDVVHRLNKMAYGRNGYAAVPLPAITDALTGGNDATISAAVGQTVHDLDDITTTIAGATAK